MLVNLVPSVDFSTASRSRQRPETKKTLPVAPDSVDPVTRTTISLEYASLQHQGHCPLGTNVYRSFPGDPDDLGCMLLCPSRCSRACKVDTHADIDHDLQGYYADAIFKFRLTFPKNYPDSPPLVQFLTDVVFHPLVSQNSGTFNLAPRFRPWRPKEHRIFDVLHWIKAAFKKHALDEIKEVDCLNKEAYRYHESTSSFAGLASQSSLLSQSAPALFDGDHSLMKGKPRDAMPFRELSQEQLQGQRTKLGLKEWQEVSE